MKLFLSIILGAIWFAFQSMVFLYAYRRNNKLNKLENFNILCFIEGLFNWIVSYAILSSTLFLFFWKPKIFSFLNFDIFLSEFVLFSLIIFFYWAFIVNRAFRKPRWLLRVLRKNNVRHEDRRSAAVKNTEVGIVPTANNKPQYASGNLVIRNRSWSEAAMCKALGLIIFDICFTHSNLGALR
jgi:vacuolar-type H+-ATPase subunit I/STV1